MPNGKPGDHPLNDILVHHLNVYGEEADAMIRKIADLSNRRELEEWWTREIGWSPDTGLIVAKTRGCLDELLKRAKDSGWETRDSQ